MKGYFERKVAEEVTFETRGDVVGEEEEFRSLEQREEGGEEGQSSRGSEVVERRENGGDGDFFCGGRKFRRREGSQMYACVRFDREESKRKRGGRNGSLSMVPSKPLTHRCPHALLRLPSALALVQDSPFLPSPPKNPNPIEGPPSSLGRGLGAGVGGETAMLTTLPPPRDAPPPPSSSPPPPAAAAAAASPIAYEDEDEVVAIGGAVEWMTMG